MKKSYISIGLLAVAGVMASCSEDWDNHYEPSDQVAQESVMELIQTDPELSTFAKMLDIAGYDDLLASSQTFTVFAPTNEALADVDLEDVDAVKRIVLNHIARFNNSTAAGDGHTVKMYNGKRFAFDGDTFGSVGLERTDIIANNGILKAGCPPMLKYISLLSLFTTSHIVMTLLSASLCVIFNSKSKGYTALVFSSDSSFITTALLSFITRLNSISLAKPCCVI